MIKKWIGVNDLLGCQYSIIRLKTPLLRLDLCDNSDAYIVLKGTIDLLPTVTNENDRAEKDVVFKNNAPFRSYSGPSAFKSGSCRLRFS